MYLISDDKRSKKSALLICYGLAECLKTKSFSDITITDIYRQSSVGRSTFYRLFDNTADVLAYQCNLLFQDTIQNFSDNSYSHSAKEYVLSFMRTCLKYPQLIRAITDSNRIDLLYETHLKYSDIIKKALFADKNISDIQMDYILSLLTSSLTSILITWQEKHSTMTPEELYGHCKSSILLFYDLLK